MLLHDRITYTSVYVIPPLYNDKMPQQQYKAATHMLLKVGPHHSEIFAEILFITLYSGYRLYDVITSEPFELETSLQQD